MAQNSTSSDAAQVSHDELFDAIWTLSRYSLNKILKNVCEGSQRDHETFQKWLFVSEDKVAQPEIPPRPENAWPAMDDDSEDSSSVDGPSDDETSETDHDEQSPDEEPTRPTRKKMKISHQEDRKESYFEMSSDEQTSGDEKVILCHKRKLSTEEEFEDQEETHGKSAGDNEARATDDNEKIPRHEKTKATLKRNLSHGFKSVHKEESHGKAVSGKAKIESDKNAKSKPPVQATRSKKLRARYSVCTNCKMEFDVRKNTYKSCFFHIGDLIKRTNMSDNPWDDEDDFSDEPDPVRAVNDPYSYYYDCCNGLGDHRGCAMDWHREKKYHYSKRPHKQKIYGYDLE